MPTTSPAQERLMQAAAHNPAGYGGVSQEVGKEFIGADAAGAVYVNDGKALVLKRADGTWGLPGGHIEQGEFPLNAALRETREELGYNHLNPLFPIVQNDNFGVYAGETPAFTPMLNDEHTEYKWIKSVDEVEPLHKGMEQVFKHPRIIEMMAPSVTELSIAKKIASGKLSSPQRYANLSLFAIRVTGTGTAYRRAADEFVYRRPENYLTPEFLERCAGLAVIFEHPAKRTLNSQEFDDRAVGSLMFAYIVGDEVWGIAKIYDDAAIEIMTSMPMSTSPAVYFHNPEVNDTIELDNGNKILIEGKPSLLDHLAICEVGVWDKAGMPKGVLNSTTDAGDVKMTEQEELKAKADAEAAKGAELEKEERSKVLAALDSIAKRMDSMEANMPAKPMQTAADSDEEKTKAEEKAKADAEAEEKTKADAQAKADSEIRAKIDAIQASLPKALADADYAQMADCQAKADSAYSAFGKRAPAPLNGESVVAYRKRLAIALKEHSPAWKGVDLHAIADSAVIDIAEGAIYADAMAASMNPVNMGGAGLFERITRSRAGHEISTFVGKISDFTNTFKSPVIKRAGKWNKNVAQ